MATQAVTRLFKFKSLDLVDPDPEMTPEQVREHYSNAYPELNNASVIEEGYQGENHVFQLKTSLGHNG